MFFVQLKRAAAFAALLLLTQSPVFAQGVPRSGSTPQRSGPRGPFTLAAPHAHNFSADGRTRVMLFAANVDLTFAETITAFAELPAEGPQQVGFLLPVEYVGKVPGQDWLTQINVRLLGGLAGDVRVSIIVHGEFSNKALVSIAPPQ